LQSRWHLCTDRSRESLAPHTCLLPCSHITSRAWARQGPRCSQLRVSAGVLRAARRRRHGMPAAAGAAGKLRGRRGARAEVLA